MSFALDHLTAASKTPPHMKVIEGANFSFMGHETEMGKVIVNFLQDCETQPAKR